MKKIFMMVLAVILLFGVSANTFAASNPKYVEVNISAPMKVEAGEIVTLTAVTLKHGSEFQDEWIGAQKVSTVLTEDGYYISTAQVTAKELVSVQYNITMTAGNGGDFVGQASTTVELDNPVSVVGAVIKNVTPVSWMTGFYTGDIYLIFSDGTTIKNGCTYFGISEEQVSRIVDVSVLVNDIQYNFNVEVSK